MRKTVIALMLVLPMLFVLAIFSSVNLVSLQVPVSVNGIRLRVDGELVGDGASPYINMSDQRDHTVTAEVLPENASEKGYTLSSDNPDVLDINSDGTVSVRSMGTANVSAVSNDKGFTATVPIVVDTDNVYGVQFALFKSDGTAVRLNHNNNSYTASRLEAGTYSYSVDLLPSTFSEYTLTPADDTIAEIDYATRTIFLPFSGEANFVLTVDNALLPSGAIGSWQDNIELNVRATSSETGIAINGVADKAMVSMEKGASTTQIYVECNGEPEFRSEHAKGQCVAEGHSGAERNARSANDQHHILEVTVEEGFEGEELDATITANGKTASLTVSFKDFDFEIRSNATLQQTDGEYVATLLRGRSTTFYVSPSVKTEKVTYEWSANDDSVLCTPSQDTTSCSVTANKRGEYVLTVRVSRNGETLEKSLSVKVMERISVIQINNITNVDLAECYTMGGQRYNGNALADNSLALALFTVKEGSPTTEIDENDIVFTVTDPTVARVDVIDGTAYVVPLQSGKVTITAEWRGNEAFNANARGSYTLNVVKDAVEVKDYPELKRATEDGLKVVLTKDIMLGTYANGTAMLSAELKQIVDEQTYTSTFNIEWYKQKGKADEAKVMYAMEFKADVYGNGYKLDAEYFTNAQDAAGQPTIFKGPLSFVALSEQFSGARVAGQDNSAFLIRTDGVKLYGVNLLGCSDKSLLNDKGQYELNNLNYVGTVLDVNADCEIINCRLSNGRNVLRTYGGNRDGTAYMVESLSSDNVADKDRIIVTVDGCVLTQSREFIVKVGTNRALKATVNKGQKQGNGQEPTLRDEKGNSYTEAEKQITVKDSDTGVVSTKMVGINQYQGIDSQYFYEHYVMTDITIKNSVLETSGLFTIGVESNFAGDVLYEGCTHQNFVNDKMLGGWQSSGGTSFASVVRLQGDVRLYDWKDIAQVDSSTLIEAGSFGGVLQGILDFNVSAMLQEVDGQEEYAKLMYKTQDNKTFVHGGIALYGGGRNYSRVLFEDFATSVNNLTHLNINIEQFSTSENPTTSRQTTLLPLAAGTHDFNFYMYTSDGPNNYDWQVNATKEGTRYQGVAKVPLFAD